MILNECSPIMYLFSQITIINRGWNGDILSMDKLDFMAYSNEAILVGSARAALGKITALRYWAIAIEIIPVLIIF